MVAESLFWEASVPRLPRGNVLFEELPARALILDELAPVLGSGIILLRRPALLGLMLAKDGQLFETYAFSEGRHLRGEEAFEQLRGQADATVAAQRLEADIVVAVTCLVQGQPCYDGLRLAWTNWKGLLGDLAARDGIFAVEISAGSRWGVTLMAGGRILATYSSEHPEPGHLLLLEDVATDSDGTVSVRQVLPPRGFMPISGIDYSDLGDDFPGIARRRSDVVPSSPEPALLEPTQPEVEEEDVPPPLPAVDLPLPSPPLPQPPLEAASLPTPPIEEALEPPSTVAEEEDGTNPTAAIEEDAIGSQPAGPSAMTAPASASAAIAAPHMAPAVAPPALAPPLPEPEISAASEPLLDAESDTLPSAAHADSAVAVATAEAELSGIPVRDVLVGFKIIARNRLQRSASRIEYLIDEGAQESRSAQDVIADVRRLSIRGVMQSTIDDVADEMVTFAQARLREGAVQ